MVNSNITTIADIASRASQAERSNQIDITEIFNQNNDYRQWIASLRREAHDRIRNGNNQLPYVDSSLDAQIIQNINNNSELSEFRTGILYNIREGVCDPGLSDFLLRNGGMGNLESIDRILRLPVNFNNYRPILNMLLLGLVGDAQIDNVIVELNVLIRTLMSQDLAEENISSVLDEIITEAHNDLDEENERTARRMERRHEEGDADRRRIFSAIPWRTVAVRAGALIASVGGMYFGQPYITPLLMNLGTRLLPNLQPTLQNPSPVTIPSTERPSWDEVSSTFFRAWNLFFRYWGGS